MEKPYALKDLALKLKSKGLDLAEDAVVHVYESVKEWYKDSAALSATPLDNLVVPFFDSIDAVVLPLADKIDGQDDAGR